MPTQITTRDLRAMGVDPAGLQALRRYGYLEPVHDGANLYWATPSLMFAASVCAAVKVRATYQSGRKIHTRYRRLLGG